MAWYKLNLELFDGTGGAAGQAAGAAAEAKAPAGGTVVTENAPESGAAPADADAQFRALIKGQYKEQYQKAINDSLQRRFRDMDGLKQQIERSKPLLDLMASKYGVSADDVDGLIKAAEADESYYETEAADKGLTVQQLKTIKAMERENAQLKAAAEERQRIERANQVQARWMQEAEATKQIYPGFDFEAEAQGETFQKLLRSGVDVRTAYEVAHHDEILSGAMQFAVNKTQEKTVNDIRARGLRPQESAAGAASPATAHIDVGAMTKAQRMEAIERARRGERITLRD